MAIFTLLLFLVGGATPATAVCCRRDWTSRQGVMPAYPCFPRPANPMQEVVRDHGGKLMWVNFPAPEKPIVFMTPPGGVVSSDGLEAVADTDGLNFLANFQNVKAARLLPPHFHDERAPLYLGLGN